MVNQPHHENLHVWSPQDFHGQSIASDEISSVGTESFRYGIENNSDSNSDKIKRNC